MQLYVSGYVVHVLTFWCVVYLFSICCVMCMEVFVYSVCEVM